MTNIMKTDRVIYRIVTLDILLDTLWTIKEPIASHEDNVKYAECLYKHGKTADSKYGITNPKFATLQEAKEFFASFATYKFVVEQKPISNAKYIYEIVILNGTNGVLMKFFIASRLW